MDIKKCIEIMRDAGKAELKEMSDILIQLRFCLVKYWKFSLHGGGAAARFDTDFNDVITDYLKHKCVRVRDEIWQLIPPEVLDYLDKFAQGMTKYRTAMSIFGDGFAASLVYIRDCVFSEGRGGVRKHIIHIHTPEEKQPLGSAFKYSWQHMIIIDYELAAQFHLELAAREHADAGVNVVPGAAAARRPNVPDAQLIEEWLRYVDNADAVVDA